MRLLNKVPAPYAIAGVCLIFVLLVLLATGFATAQHSVFPRASHADARRSSTPGISTNADGAPQLDLFFPLTPGTWWLYRGTVTWADQQTEKDAHADVTLKMTVEKAIRKPEFLIAVLSGFPRDLDWATGEVAAMPWLLIETTRHEVFLNPLPPDFDYAKLDKDAAALDKFLAEDNLLFRWPLKQGMKFGDAESVRRNDGHYCWVVATRETKKLGDIQGVAAKSAEVFQLQYVTNPDDTEMEISPGIGILNYQYHHHGAVAETDLSLVEFHPAPSPPAAPGTRP